MEKTDKTLRNTNLSIDKENLIIIYLTVDFGPHPGILQRDLELNEIFFIAQSRGGRMEYPLIGRCDHLTITTKRVIPGGRFHNYDN